MDLKKDSQISDSDFAQRHIVITTSKYASNMPSSRIIENPLEINENDAYIESECGDEHKPEVNFGSVFKKIRYRLCPRNEYELSNFSRKASQHQLLKLRISCLMM